jgi:fructokinase
MSIAIGLDIGGTKIAGAGFDDNGHDVAKAMVPTPADYDSFLDACLEVIDQIEQQTGKAATIGACAPYADENVNSNIRCLIGKPLRRDLERILRRPVALANDANCAALAEAMEGAGQGYDSVFGLILGTGVGGGFVMNGRVYAGTHGLMGEIGHLPLPFYEDADGELVECACGQKGCIDKLASGPGLARLYKRMTGKEGDGHKIADLYKAGDADAKRVLDRFYTVIAKAMVTVIHTFDPEIITVSGGLNALPGLYDEVPKRWGHYALVKNPKNKFVHAKHGATAGLRGAAWLGKNAV